MSYQVATTRQVLKALREVGLSARSGCHPVSTRESEHLDAEVLEGMVVNVCPYRQIGYGCWQHPQLDAVLDELSSRAAAALKLINCEFRHIRHANGRPSGQFFINGYKKA